MASEEYFPSALVFLSFSVLKKDVNNRYGGIMSVTWSMEESDVLTGVMKFYAASP